MEKKDLYVNDTSNKIIVSMDEYPYDFTDADVKILLIKPNGQTLEKDGVKENNSAYFITQAGDIDIPGVWRAKGLISNDGFVFYTKEIPFVVYPELPHLESRSDGYYYNGVKITSGQNQPLLEVKNGKLFYNGFEITNANVPSSLSGGLAHQALVKKSDNPGDFEWKFVNTGVSNVSQSLEGEYGGFVKIDYTNRSEYITLLAKDNPLDPEELSSTELIIQPLTGFDFLHNTSKASVRSGTFYGSFDGDGSKLTNLPTSDLTNYARKDQPNTFSGKQTIQGGGIRANNLPNDTGMELHSPANMGQRRILLSPDSDFGVGRLQTNHDNGQWWLVVDDGGNNPRDLTTLARTFVVWGRMATAPAVTVRGSPAQTADLQQWQNEVGTVRGRVHADGNKVSLGQYAGQGVLAGSGAAAFIGTSTAEGDRAGFYLSHQTSPGGFGFFHFFDGTTYLDSYGGGSLIYRFGPQNTNTLSVGLTGTFVFPANHGVTPLVVRGDTGQTADLQQWQTSTGAMRFAVAAEGERAVLRYAPTTSQAGLSIRAGDTEVARIQDNTAVVAGSFETFGGMTWGTFVARRGNAGTLEFGNTGGPAVTISNEAGGQTVTFAVRGRSSQSEDLQQWQTSTGSYRTAIAANGDPILTSPNGTRYRLLVADNGTLSTVAF